MKILSSGTVLPIPVISCYLFLVTFFSAAAASANGFCFSTAENYYEQVYCQLQAENDAAGLPTFNDFKKNDERIQALLLKPHARRVGITIAMPRKSVRAVQSNRAVVVQRPARPSLNHSPLPRQPEATPAASTAPGCQLSDTMIHCGQSRYQLVGNRNNKQLDAAVFSAANRMQLPRFSAVPNDAWAVSAYLQQAYGQYIQKMMELGLGGVTMSYAKFAYLFDDYQSKQVDFVDRFETMYYYLKLDKQNNAINTAINAPAGMAYDHCQDFGQFVACAFNNRNYLYIAQFD